MISLLIGIIVGTVCLFIYSYESVRELRSNLSIFFSIFLVPPIMFELVYIMKKDIVILNKLGTLQILAILELLIKIALSSLVTYLSGIFSSFTECIIFAIALFAQDNQNITNSMAENDVSQDKQVFIQSASLFCNVLTIVMATSLHPLILHKFEPNGIIISQRIFFNIFFTMFIGICLAFFSSYFLKSAYSQISHFDNFDIVMIMIPPFLAYLLAESASISGLISLMACAFVQSIYGKQNLQEGRSLLVDRTFRALSYVCRSICELLIGITLPLSYSFLKTMNVWHVIASLIIFIIVPYLSSYLSCLVLIKRKFLDLQEQKILCLQSGVIGILAMTLALQNPDSILVGLVHINVIFSIMIKEPISHFLLLKCFANLNDQQKQKDSEQASLKEAQHNLSEEHDHENNDQRNQQEEMKLGCFKHCLVNLHIFTFSQFLLKDRDLNNSIASFEKFNDSMNTQQQDKDAQVIEMSNLVKKSARKYNGKVSRSDSKSSQNSRIGGKILSDKKHKKKLNRSSPGNFEDIELKQSVFQ